MCDSESQRIFTRYQALQRYAAWMDEDAERVRRLGPLIEPHLSGLVEDFYEEIERHPDAAKVITGGTEQVARLKGTLIRWLQELFSGVYDAAYVARRRRVGLRHVEIGLDQVYTNMALSRLRIGLIRTFSEIWCGPHADLVFSLRSLHKLLDLDLAIIEDAYQSEYLRRHQQVERMAAIGQVAGGIAHELRNPLNVIRTSVYYLLNARQVTPDKFAEHLRRIHNQVGLADGVITALSNFARLPLPSLEPFELEPMIRETLAACSLPAEIAVALDVQDGSSRPLGDPSQLQIVFSNLIRNARDAMPGGGWLTISARADGDAIVVSVADTGTGIPHEHIGRIMEPLYTTKARGIGLGLAIARAIVDKHRGQISVASRPQHGTTFTVRLPATPV